MAQTFQALVTITIVSVKGLRKTLGVRTLPAPVCLPLLCLATVPGPGFLERSRNDITTQHTARTFTLFTLIKKS